MTSQRECLTNQIRCMVRQHPEWSTGAIAKELGADPRRVSTVRSRMKKGYDVLQKIRSAAQRLEKQVIDGDFP